jgi:hypothetical protein
LRAPEAKMACIETRGAFGAQGRHPVDGRARVALARCEAALRTRLIPSKAMLSGIRVAPSMAQAFFAASGLTCLTFAVPAGSGGR